MSNQERLRQLLEDTGPEEAPPLALIDALPALLDIADADE